MHTVQQSDFVIVSRKRLPYLTKLVHLPSFARRAEGWGMLCSSPALGHPCAGGRLPRARRYVRQRTSTPEVI
jgi:hypothetical protein